MQQSEWIDLETVWQTYFEQGIGRSERLSTGFPSLDKVLCGGLSSGLIVLGGTAGVGKSTLALQIAIHAAEQEHPVLYFSMEMPANYLLAKTINQKAHQSTHSVPITVNSLMDGTLGPAQQQMVAADIMPKLPTQYLHICTKPMTAFDILKWAKALLDQLPKQGKKPLVIVDYLQILRPEKESQSDKQIVENSVRRLLQLAHNFDSGPDRQSLGASGGLPVILISSLNRSAYKGSMEQSAFKETGNIEYSADLLLGLQFRACRRDDFDPKKEQRKSPRELELVVLKNRYGSSGDAIPLQYDPSHDYFYPPAEDSETADTPANNVQTSSAATELLPSMTIKSGPSETKTPKKPAALSDSFTCYINSTEAAKQIRKGKCEHKYTLKGSDIEIYYFLTPPLSCLDCCVADAIYTAYRRLEHKAKKEISLRAILHALSGSKTTALTDTMSQELRDSIKRLHEAEFHLKCTGRLRGWNEKDWDYEGPFLAIEEPGQEDVCFRPDSKAGIYGVLPLHTFGEIINHLTKVSSILLDVQMPDGKHRMSNTEDNICLKRFLAHRMAVVEDMMSKPSSGENKKLVNMRKISFGTGNDLLLELRFPKNTAYEQRVHRLYQSAESILKYYEKIGYIDGFTWDVHSEDQFPTFEVGKIKGLQDIKPDQPR